VTATPEPTLRPALSGAGARLVVDFGRPYRCVSSAVLGGGLGWVRTWLDLEVERPYTRTDPDVHLLEESADLPSPVVGMLTAARVVRFRRAAVGGARSVVTVGVGHALAAATNRPRAVPLADPPASGARNQALPGQPSGPPTPGARDQGWASRRGSGWPCVVPEVGTINLLVVVDEPLTDAGLVNALQTAVEAKAQALAAARVPAANADGYATGTATDSVCVACPPGARVPFAGPVTRVGAELALAVLEAVRSGAELDRAAAAAASTTTVIARATTPSAVAANPGPPQPTAGPPRPTAGPPPVPSPPPAGRAAR
jgi:adenosylcobinamide hydrolase